MRFFSSLEGTFESHTFWAPERSHPVHSLSPWLHVLRGSYLCSLTYMRTQPTFSGQGLSSGRCPSFLRVGSSSSLWYKQPRVRRKPGTKCRHLVESFCTYLLVSLAAWLPASISGILQPCRLHQKLGFIWTMATQPHGAYFETSVVRFPTGLMSGDSRPS